MIINRMTSLIRKSILLLITMVIFIVSLFLISCQEGDDIYDRFAGHRDSSSNDSDKVNTVGLPTFVPEGGTYPSVKEVTLTVVSPADATIIYTTDGSYPMANSDCSPINSSMSIASGSTVTITETGYLKAIGCYAGYLGSYLKSESYNITKRVFTTTESYAGNFETIAVADGYCNTDPNKPTSREYKAMIVDASENRKASVPQVNWVLKPSTEYYRKDGFTYIAKTNSNALLNLNILLSSFGNSGDAYWTGLTINWNTSTETCSSWTSDMAYGTYGMDNQRNAGAVAYAVDVCSIPKKILCVEQ